ncbi:MAG: hypothetical protein ACRDGA_03130 [Bacteroidota bacterium]
MKTNITISLVASATLMLLLWSSSCTQLTTPRDERPDTTSHNFAWQTFVLGDGNSILYDVAIVNDTLAYAVGRSG